MNSGHPSFWRVGCAGVLLAGFLLIAGCEQVSEQQAQQRELVAAGRSSFRAYCAGCHGVDATGGGPTADYMTVEPADLTRIAENYGRYPAELVYKRIDGSEIDTTQESLQMPHWGRIWRGATPDMANREDTHARVEELVAYLRSVQVE